MLNFDQEMQDELTFFGIDYEEANTKIIQEFFNQNPIPDTDTDTKSDKDGVHQNN